VGTVGCQALLSSGITSAICYTCIPPIESTITSAIAKAQQTLTIKDVIDCQVGYIPDFLIDIENTPCSGLVESGYKFSRTAAWFRVNGSLVWNGLAVSAGSQTQTQGLVSLGGGQYGASIPNQSLASGDVIEIGSASLADATADANQDGRFNAADATEVASWIGQSPVPDEVLRAADFNDDGAITQDEVDLLNQLLGLGLGSGVFGDANGNGVANCDDLTAADAAWGTSFGQSGYFVALDLNLDVDLTNADRVAFYRLIGRADFNLDGFKDFFDYDDYLAAFGDGLPSAVWNSDGFIDGFDYDAFVEDFENGC
jgi:hypothetical protein